MRSRIGIISILLLLTSQCFSLNCRTCKNDGCFKTDALVINCNKNVPILPFQTQLHKNKEKLQYGCLHLEYFNGNSVDTLQQCILTEGLNEFCQSITKNVNVITCRVNLPTESRLKRAVNDDNNSIDEFQIISTENNRSDITFLPSNLNDDAIQENNKAEENIIVGTVETYGDSSSHTTNPSYRDTTDPDNLESSMDSQTTIHSMILTVLSYDSIGSSHSNEHHTYKNLARTTTRTPYQFNLNLDFEENSNTYNSESPESYRGSPTQTLTENLKFIESSTTIDLTILDTSEESSTISPPYTINPDRDTTDLDSLENSSKDESTEATYSTILPILPYDSLGLTTTQRSNQFNTNLELEKDSNRINSETPETRLDLQTTQTTHLSDAEGSGVGDDFTTQVMSHSYKDGSETYVITTILSYDLSNSDKPTTADEYLTKNEPTSTIESINYSSSLNPKFYEDSTTIYPKEQVTYEDSTIRTITEAVTSLDIDDVESSSIDQLADFTITQVIYSSTEVNLNTDESEIVSTTIVPYVSTTLSVNSEITKSYENLITTSLAEISYSDLDIKDLFTTQKDVKSVEDTTIYPATLDAREDSPTIPTENPDNIEESDRSGSTELTTAQTTYSSIKDDFYESKQTTFLSDDLPSSADPDITNIYEDLTTDKPTTLTEITNTFINLDEFPTTQIDNPVTGNSESEEDSQTNHFDVLGPQEVTHYDNDLENSKITTELAVTTEETINNSNAASTSRFSFVISTLLTLLLIKLQ